ncbi:MAG: protease complex subunit PrcB family protein [Polyangiaceae bacterium]|nr:protease complex subunit PrcB family protein [Polyangiaceae bacterium]
MGELPVVQWRTLAKGERSDRTAAAQLVIDDAATWQRVWREHTANQIPGPPAPAVDFGRERVVAVFAGEKPSSGHAVDIVSVATRQAGERAPVEVVVTVRSIEPPPGAAVLDVITSPYHMIAISRIPGARVTFTTV